MLRLPSDLHERIVKRAADNNQSMNSEVIALLTNALGSPKQEEYRALIQEFQVLNRMRHAAHEQLRELTERADKVRLRIMDLDEPG